MKTIDNLNIENTEIKNQQIHNLTFTLCPVIFQIFYLLYICNDDMQNIRQLITTPRWKINYLLRRYITISNTTNINVTNLNLTK